MQPKVKSILYAALAAMSLAGGGNAYAAACSTAGGAVVGTATTADATLSLSGGPETSSDACEISKLGNGGNTNGPLLDTAYGSYNDSLDPNLFVRIAKLGEGPDPAFMGMSFTLTATGAIKDSKEGTWTLDWSGGPANLDLVLAIHASDRVGTFLFDNRDLQADSDGTGSWEIHWLNNGGKVPGFSNMTVWARKGLDEVAQLVPVPGTVALLGAGLFGLGLRGRRSL